MTHPEAMAVLEDMREELADDLRRAYRTAERGERFDEYVEGVDQKLSAIALALNALRDVYPVV